MKEKIYMSLDADIAKKLKAIAKADRRSVSNLVSVIVEDYFKELKND